MESKRDDIRQLIQDAQNGDEQAMTELITIHKGLVFTIVLRMTDDYHASQDLTQETFIKVFMNIRKVKNAEHFKPWICTIARNVVRDYFRKAKRTQTVSFEQIKEFHGHSNIEVTRRRVMIQDALAVELLPGPVEDKIMMRLQVRRAQDMRSFWLYAYRMMVLGITAAIACFALLPFLLRFPLISFPDLSKYTTALAEFVGGLAPANSIFMYIGFGYILLIASSIYALVHIRR